MKLTKLAMRGVMGLGGALVGGLIGFALTKLLAEHFSLYAIILPGAGAGLGCGWALRRRSLAMGFICGLLGLAAGILTEGWLFPFQADASLRYFLANLHDLQSHTKLLLGVGALFGFWFGCGRDYQSSGHAQR